MEKERRTNGVKQERVSCMAGTITRTNRARSHPGVPGAPLLTELCPSLPYWKKGFTRLSSMPGRPVSPVAASINFLQTQILRQKQIVQLFKVCEQETRSIRRKRVGEQVTFSLMGQEETKGDF